MTAPTTTPPSGTAPMDLPKLAARVQRLLDKNKGDPTEAIELLLTENAGYRDRHREDQTTIANLRQQVTDSQGKVPGAEDLVLKGDEAKVYKTFAELKTTPQEVIELRAVKLREERMQLMRKAGEAVKFKPDVLSEVLQMKGMALVLQETSVLDDKDKSKMVKKELPFVRPVTDEKAALKPLTEYIEEHAKDYLLALRMDAAGASRGIRTQDGRSEGTFTAYPAQSSAQSSTGTPPSRDVVKAVEDSMGFAAPSDLTRSDKKTE